MGSYSAYLSSSHWREVRAKAIESAGHQCERCNAQPETLHVHHKTYERIGEEQLSDLEVLCPSCHGREHPDTDFDKREFSWLGEDQCEACGHTVSRLQLYPAGKIAAMCLRCGNEEVKERRAPRELGAVVDDPDRDPRSIACPLGCRDKMFRTEYGMSQHLEDRHGWEWSDTPAGKKHPRNP